MIRSCSKRNKIIYAQSPAPEVSHYQTCQPYHVTRASITKMLKKLMQKLNRVGVGSLHVLNTKIFKKAYSNVGKPTKCAIQQHSTAPRTGCLTVQFTSSLTDLDHNSQHVSFICIIHNNIFYCIYNNFYRLIFYTYLYDTLLTVN